MLPETMEPVLCGLCLVALGEIIRTFEKEFLGEAQEI